MRHGFLEGAADLAMLSAAAYVHLDRRVFQNVRLLGDFRYGGGDASTIRILTGDGLQRVG
jgi:hypothetical protein